jgi:hypothetical protein
MNEVPTLDQIVAFGDFSAVQTNSESIKYFLDAFSDLDLVPSLPDPVPAGILPLPIANVFLQPKVTFRSSEGPWLVGITNQRLDIFCQKRSTEGPTIAPVAEFIERAIKIVSAVVERYPTKFSRMSLVTRHSWIDWEAETLVDYYLKLIKSPGFFSESPPHEWATRFSSRRKLESIENEEMNVIATLTRADLVTVLSPQEVTEGIEIALDLNTIPENTELRFSTIQLKAFLAEMKDFEESTRSDFRNL